MEHRTEMPYSACWWLMSQEVTRSIDNGEEGMKPIGDDEAMEDKVLGMRPIDSVEWLWSPISSNR